MILLSLKKGDNIMINKLKHDENWLTNIFCLSLLLILAGGLMQVISRILFLFNKETPIFFLTSNIFLTIGVISLLTVCLFFAKRILREKRNNNLKKWINDIWISFNSEVKKKKSKKELNWEREEYINKRVECLARNLEKKSKKGI